MPHKRRSHWRLHRKREFPMNLSPRLEENIAYLEMHLPLKNSFDLMHRTLKLGETKAFFLGVNGFCKTEILQQIFSDLQNPLYVPERKDRKSVV